MANDNDDDVSTAATILQSLDVVLFELGRIDNLWLEMPRDVVNTSIIHEARRRTHELLEAANAYLQWVADTRLEPPTN
jgi:hypothetical protein